MIYLDKPRDSLERSIPDDGPEEIRKPCGCECEECSEDECECYCRACNGPPQEWEDTAGERHHDQMNRNNPEGL